MGKTNLIFSRQKGCDQFSSVLVLILSMDLVLVAGVACDISPSGKYCEIPVEAPWSPVIFLGDLGSLPGSGIICDIMSDIINFLINILNAMFFRSLKFLRTVPGIFE